MPLLSQGRIHISSAYMANHISKRDFSVAVVGGGICGLAVAAGLTIRGVDVDIYEAAERFGEIGAGVAFGPNAIRALRELGILDEILARSGQDKPERRPNRFVSGFGEHEALYEYPSGPDDTSIALYRPVFIEALAHLIRPEKTHFNKRCTSVSLSSQCSNVGIKFSDGTKAEADIVLGADGIRSVIRSYVVDSPSRSGSEVGNERENDSLHLITRAVFTNTVAYRGLVPFEIVNKLDLKVDLSPRPLCWVGHGNHIITFPTKSDTMLNIVAFACDRSVRWGERPLLSGQPWVTPRNQAELLDTFSGWGSDAIKLLRCIESPSTWSIHAINPPLEHYSRKQVALLGDAAHGMLPHLGAGAGQGIQDALVLVKLLTHPRTKKTNIEIALEAYSLVRQPHANAVLEASTRTGDVYDGCGPNGPTSEGLKEDLFGFRDIVWHHDLHSDIDRAEKWFLARLESSY